MTKELQMLLLQSLDETLSREDMQRLDDALAISDEVRMELERLQRLREIIKENAPSRFNMFFVDRVLRKVSSVEDDFTEWLGSFLREIALVGSLVIVLIMGFNLSQEGTLDLSSALAIPKPTFTQVLAPQIIDWDIRQ